MWDKVIERCLKIFTALFGGGMLWKAGRDNLHKDQAEATSKVRKESDAKRDEIVKLSKADLRVRGSKWVRPND